MADEPESLILQLLREVRAEQKEHSQRLDAIERQLKALDRKVDDLELGVNQAVGLASRALVRSAQAHDDTRLLTTRLEDLDRRLAALEAR